MSDNPHRTRRSDASPNGLRKHKTQPAEAASAGHDAKSAASASLQRALERRGKPTPADLISAQRTLGNRALQRILAEHSGEIAKAKEESTRHLTDEKQDEHMLQETARKGDPEKTANAEILSKIEEERGHGTPIDNRVGRHVGRKIGADFSGVRVHTDNRADVLNRVFRSQAFTVGRDIFFSRNAYRPGDLKGQGLVAHELIHVVQQGGDKSAKVQAKFAVAPAADQYEREANRAARMVAPRRLDAMPAPQAPLSGPLAATNRQKLQPGARAGVVQRAGTGATPGQTDQKPLPDLRKGDVVLTRRQLLEQKKDLREAVQRNPGYGAEQTEQPVDLTKGATLAPGAANDMIQRMWGGQLKLMKPEFGYSALAMGRKDIAHSEDGHRVRRDPEEILAGSEVYRTSDKTLSQNAADQTSKWSEIETKLRKAYSKALEAKFDITDQSKRRAAVLAAYALAGKLRPKDLFAAEFTTMAHQAAALMPAIKELINAEGQGKRSRKSWGKVKGSRDGARDWVERNISKMRLPPSLAGMDPKRVKPEMMPAAMHFLGTKNRPKWQFEGIL